MKDNFILAAKYWIKAIIAYLILGLLAGYGIIFFLWVIENDLFRKIIPNVIIGTILLVVLIILYKLLDRYYPFEEIHDLNKSREHSDKKRWWHL